VGIQGEMGKEARKYGAFARHSPHKIKNTVEKSSALTQNRGQDQ